MTSLRWNRWRIIPLSWLDRAYRLASGIALSLAAGGCDQAPSTALVQREPSALSLLITADAPVTVEGNAFVFPPHSLRRTAADQISGQDAASLARGFARIFTGWRQLEKSRGARFKQQDLTACGTPRYAASRFQPMPQNASLSLRRAFGPYWLMRMCTPDAVPVAVFAVSALATPVTVDANGDLSRPIGSDGGNVFFWIPIALGTTNFAALEPEASVRALLEHIGSGKIVQQPELLVPDPREGTPTAAAWRVVLDAPHRIIDERGRETQTDRFEISMHRRYAEAPSSLITAVVPASFGNAKLAAAADLLPPPLRDDLAQRSIRFQLQRP